MDIDNMKFYEHKVICLFSMIDMFSQNYINYRNEDFCNFIEKYADEKKYYFLKKIDPVTLLYDINNCPQNTINISQLEDANIYTVNSKEIEELLEDINREKLPKEIIEKHKYSKLIYKFRCKIAHERNLIGGIATIEENNYKYPIYIDFSGYWKLIFPYTFLKDLFTNCINNYLEECKKYKKDPFENNNMEKRKAFYGFWDGGKDGQVRIKL